MVVDDVVEGECEVTTTAAAPLDLREPFDFDCCVGVDILAAAADAGDVFEIVFNVVMS